MKSGLWVGLLVWPLVAQQPAAKGVNFYSPEREIRIGREAAFNLEHTLPVVHVAKLDAYLGKLGAALTNHSGAPQPFSFTVFDDRKPFTAYPGELAMPADAFGSHEPVALPGGFVFVPLSAIAASRDEAALAFQLAHAMAHIARRHGSRRATREELAGMVGVDVSIRVPVIQVDLSAGRELAGRLAGLQYARTLELEGDRVAAAMVAQAGFDPEAFVRYLEAQPPASGSRTFSAEPAIAKRIAVIEEAIALLPLRTYANSSAEFAQAQALALAIQ